MTEASELPPSLEDSDPKPVQNILDAGFPYKVKFGCIGTERRIRKNVDLEVKSTTSGADPDKDAVSIVVKIIDPDDCPEFQAILDKQQEIRHYIEARSNRSVFLEGVYIVRTQHFMDVRNRVKTGQTELAALVETFLGVYPQIIEKAKSKLKAAYNPGLFMDADRVREAIYVRARIIDAGIDEAKIKAKLGDAVLAEELAELQKEMSEAKDAIQDGLVAEFEKLATRMFEIVSGTEDGKAKRFKDAAFTNLKEFCDFFDAKDLGNFAKLREKVNAVKAMIGDKDPDDIRGSKSVRAVLAKGFAPIVADLKTMVLPKGERKVVLD